MVGGRSERPGNCGTAGRAHGAIHHRRAGLSSSPDQGNLRPARAKYVERAARSAGTRVPRYVRAIPIVAVIEFPCPTIISMVCHTGSGVGTTAGREIRVEAKLPARDLSLLPERRFVTSAGLRSARGGVRGGCRMITWSGPHSTVLSTCWSRMRPHQHGTRTFFAHFGTNRTQGQNGDTLEGGMRRTIKPAKPRAEILRETLARL